jgi:hypothetical protein
MAKQSGLGWTTFSVDSAAGTPVDLRNDTPSIQFATPRAMQDVTGLDKSANERLALLADASLTAETIFNPTGSHTVYSTVSSTSVIRTVSLGIGGKALAMEMWATDYPLQCTNTGEFTASVPFVLADGTVPTWS